MITYDKLLETAFILKGIDGIYTQGLILHYTISPKEFEALALELHKKLYNKSVKNSEPYINIDHFEVAVYGLLFKFTKNN